MDLLAFVSDSNEIVLNRLSGQRVWLVSAHLCSTSDYEVTALTWRPDGKVLAIGYNTGDIQYLDVNDGKIISNLPHAGQNIHRVIAIMRWAESSSTEWTETVGSAFLES